MAPKAPPPTIHPPSVPTPKPNVVPPGQPSNANRTPLDAEAEVLKDFVQTLQFKERITQWALFPESEETQKGHMRQTRQGVRSTKVIGKDAMLGIQPMPGTKHKDVYL